MQAQRSKAEHLARQERLLSSYEHLRREFSAQDLSKVGNYSIVKFLAKGSYGKVYLARHDLINGAKVVLKSVGKHESDNLPREIHNHRQFKHQHIAQLYEVVVTENSVWLVLEYCAGDELYNYLCRKGALPVETVQKIFTQLVGAVSYIHSKSCVHRDLKLENVLLDKHDNVKLCDFGFTRQYEGKASYLQTFCGTVCYSAPEMLKGEKYAAEKVDIWGLGVILYALLKGELPWDSEDDVENKRKILNDDPVFPDTFPPAAVDLLKKLLSKRPFHRPTLADVLNDPFLSQHAPQQQAILKLAQPAPFSTELEKYVLERMKSAGVDIDKCIESVLSQRCDVLAGWWALLLEKESRKHEKRERKRAEIKLLRRLSGASGRLNAVLPEVSEEGRPTSNHHDRTRSSSRGRRNRRSTPQILVTDLPQLPEGSPVTSPIGNITQDRSNLRSRSNSRSTRPPLPPKGPSREWKRRSSNLQLVVSHSDAPLYGIAKRPAQTRAGKAKRNTQFLTTLKQWFVDTTKRAKSPMGKLASISSTESASKLREKSHSQPHLSLHEPLAPERPANDRALSGSSTILTARNNSYGNALTPVTSAGHLNGASKEHHRAGSNGSSNSYHQRVSVSPSPMTPRGSRRFSSNTGLRGRKSTSSSVSSIRSMPRHHNTHSKASSLSSDSGIHSPGSIGLAGRSPHASVKVLPAGPTFTSNGRLIRNTNDDAFSSNSGSTAPISKFNESMIGNGGVMFAKRKKTAFPPRLNANLFTQQSVAPSLGSPAFFGGSNKHREASDSASSRLFGRKRGPAATGASNGSGSSLSIPQSPSTAAAGKRKSVIVEEDEEEAEALDNAILEGDEDEVEDSEEDVVEEVDEFYPPILRSGERLDSITYIEPPADLSVLNGSAHNEKPIMERVASQALLGTPMVQTPKISLDTARRGSGEGDGRALVGVGESATTPRVEVGGWSR